MDRNYLPGTQTTRRRPDPTEFAHLRKWVEPVEQNIALTSVADITNITQQLEQSAVLYLNNIVSRVIAQLTATFGDGFVSLAGTEDGALHVQLAAGTNVFGALAAGSAMVGSIENAGTAKTLLKAVINIATGASHEIIAAVSGEKIHVCNFMFTVAGEVNVTLQSAANAISGALDFGGTDEPRAMVHNFGDFPLVLTVSEAFNILLSAAVQVSGYVTYFTEA